MTSKDTNPKDAVGIRKWRVFSALPLTVIAEAGVALLEGARKYGRHNYRVAGVRASVYVDAAMGHVMQWWEGEDVDADSGLSHITKAIASLIVLRDAMIQDMLADDRPPRGNLDELRPRLQANVDQLFDRYPDPVPAFTQRRGEAPPVRDAIDMGVKAPVWDPLPRDENGKVCIPLNSRYIHRNYIPQTRNNDE